MKPTSALSKLMSMLRPSMRSHLQGELFPELRGLSPKAHPYAFAVKQPKGHADRASGEQGTPRQILLGQTLVSYQLKRSRRRSIGFLIADDGLRITAPFHASVAVIEDALLSKQGWVLEKLGQWSERQSKNVESHCVMQDGGVFPFLGQNLTIRTFAQASETVQFDPWRRILLVRAADHDQEGIQKIVHRWLQTQARDELGERVRKLEPRVDMPLRGWRLSGASGRWGSCTSRGTIRLNWRLIHFPPAVLDYVVAHEMAHLVELNHSARFWQLVERLCPGHEQARNLLAEYQPSHIPVFS